MSRASRQRPLRRSASMLSPRTAQFAPLEARRLLAAEVSLGQPVNEPQPLEAPAALVEAGDQGANPLQASSQGEQSDLRVYSWHDWEIEGVVPMVWVRMSTRTPEQAAAETIPTLLQRGEGERALLLWHLGDAFTDRPLEQIVREGMNTAPDKAWLTRYFGLLKEAGVTPDFIAMDYEDGVSVWHEDKQDVKRIIGNPALARYLPEALRQYRPEHFEPGHRLWREAVTAWNIWAGQVGVEALREAVRDPARAVFGREIDMSNYGDMTPGTPVLDNNGWALDQETATSVAGWSSPWLYLGDDGQLHAKREDPAWSRFTENLNKVRSALQAGDKVAPWISYPSYGGDRELWAEHLRQVRASGVDTILLWNPEAIYTGHDAEGYEAEKQFARDTFAQAFAIQNEHRVLPLLDHQNHEVETAGYAYNRLTGQRRQPVAATRDTKVTPPPTTPVPDAQRDDPLDTGEKETDSRTPRPIERLAPQVTRRLTLEAVEAEVPVEIPVKHVAPAEVASAVDSAGGSAVDSAPVPRVVWQWQEMGLLEGRPDRLVLQAPQGVEQARTGALELLTEPEDELLP